MDNTNAQAVLDDPEIQQAILDGIFRTYINPEIERRQKAGNLESPFELIAALVVLSPDGSECEVRLNSEVSFHATPIYKPGVLVTPDAPVFAGDLEGIEGIQLMDSDDPDSGYIVLLLLNGVWHLKFDFRRNKCFAGQLLDVAKQFHEAAGFSLEKRHLNACLDNLFSAAELSAKAYLIQTRFDLLKSRKHSAVQTFFNMEASLDNIPPEHCDVLNQLRKLRNPARYLERDLIISEQDAQHFFDVVRDMIDTTLNGLGNS